MREKATNTNGDSFHDPCDAELPSWARDLGLERHVFCQLIEVALARGVAPTDLVREWVNEMAQDSLS